MQVAAGLRAGARAPQIAQQIAKAAFLASVDRGRTTPYARAATEAFDMVYSGGKKVRGRGQGLASGWQRRVAPPASTRTPAVGSLKPQSLMRCARHEAFIGRTPQSCLDI
jgi:hypothetical protein